MPHLFDILNQAEYERARESRYVKVQSHPSLPLLIHNYTDAATWDDHWTEVTLTCRGLVTHVDTGEVIARPFRKFFNHDQALAPTIGEEDTVMVMDKADGSLGILVPTDEGHIIATRGSFTSTQAQWATGHFQEHYAATFTPNTAWTYLFEVVYPDNRIVVDYGTQTDLILLGAVDIASGATIPLEIAALGWPGPIVEVFPFTSLAQVLASPQTHNAEGFVVWHPGRDERVKVKFAEYKRLHKLLTGTNIRNVWEILSAGEDPVTSFASAPDEFHGWLKEQVTQLRSQYEHEEAQAFAAYREIISTLPVGFERKEFARVASTHPMKVYLFLLLDERSVAEQIWKTLKPVHGGQTLRSVTSDAN